MQTVAQLVADLKRLSDRFKQLSLYPGEHALEHWIDLRSDGNMLLNDLWISGVFRNLPIMKGLNEIINAGSVLTRAFLFDHLIGFTLSPKERRNELQSSWYFAAGLLNQPSIWIDSYRSGQDWDSLYRRYGFTLCERCARGCEMVAEIIEHEMAADKQADEDGVGFQLNGTLSENDRSILIAMLELNADKIHPRASKEILGAVIFENEVGDSKRAFDNLMSLKLIESKRGPSGGRWLTEQGMAIAKDLKSRSDGIVPTN